MLANPDDLDGTRPLPPPVKRVTPRRVLRPWVENVRDFFLALLISLAIFAIFGGASLFVTPRASRPPHTAEVTP